jgi:hypothetical protein
MNLLVQFLVPDVKIQSVIMNLMTSLLAVIGVPLVQMITERVVVPGLAGPVQKRGKHLLDALIQREAVFAILL